MSEPKERQGHACCIMHISHLMNSTVFYKHFFCQTEKRFEESQKKTCAELRLRSEQVLRDK